MSLSNGWFSPSGKERLHGIEGYFAELLFFFHAPHRTLVVRLRNTEPSGERLYLVCVNTRRIEVAANWRVTELCCSKVDQDTLRIEDVERSIRIDCYAARLFEEDAFKHWLGTNGWLAEPSEDDLQAVLSRSLES